jgi:hypothetical protein
MDQLRPQLPFCSKFYGCKLLEILYLFVSQQSVNLSELVMLTDKTEHFFLLRLRMAIADCVIL